MTVARPVRSHASDVRSWEEAGQTNSVGADDDAPDVASLRIDHQQDHCGHSDQGNTNRGDLRKV